MSGLLQKAVLATFEFEETKAVGRVGRIKGYASTFKNVDLGGDTVEPGAFTEWLGELKASGKRIKMTDTHVEAIGDYDVAKEDEHGLYLEGEPLKGVRAAEETMIKAKAEVYDSMSIGYRIKKGGFFYDDDNVRHLTRLEIPETAILAFPMNPQASIVSAKGLNDIRNFEKFLRDAAGLSIKEAKTLLGGGWSALVILRDAADPELDGKEEFLAQLQELRQQLGGSS